jgi:uncharacterized protein YyaL (SSP411 family)
VIPLLNKLFVIFLVSAFAQNAASVELNNQLAEHPSPYLALHGNDPVHWQEWDEHVLERARQENKLVFLSIGYFACHWCHVMQRESFQDSEVAAYINKHFIPVKIDRELQEALDARMIEFAEETRGRAGWPLNVFITPEGYPLYAELYLPRQNFLELLVKLEGLWEADMPGMTSLARQDIAEAEPLPAHEWDSAAAGALAESLGYVALDRADPLH